jgi:hypothetical protein
MTESTRRALRTLYQGLIAVVVTIPLLAGVAAALPEEFPYKGRIVAILLTLAAVTAAVSKVLNELEDRGLVPAWLKGTPEDGLEA